MKGTVKFYNFKKRFGFITGEDGKDYFVHLSGIKPGQMIRDGDEVLFNVVKDERGAKAVDVEKI